MHTTLCKYRQRSVLVIYGILCIGVYVNPKRQKIPTCTVTTSAGHYADVIAQWIKLRAR